MPTRDIIVIGGSTGAVEALMRLVAGLPADFPAAVFVTVHTTPPSLLPQILARAGRLPASHPRDGDRIERGRIYVPPPDHHLLIEPERVRVVRGPKENGHRPALDPMFRTAAVLCAAVPAEPVDAGHRRGGRVPTTESSSSAGTRTTRRKRGGATARASPDAWYDTYNHMQKNGANRKWEIALPNGLYTVRLVAGDSSATDSTLRMSLEGQVALSGTPSGDVRWFRSTTNVLVSDGRLTLTNTPGARNNKIAFIDIKAAGHRAQPGPVTGTLPVRLYGPATASMWHRKPNGLFADNQIDEPLWT